MSTPETKRILNKIFPSTALPSARVDSGEYYSNVYLELNRSRFARILLPEPSLAGRAPLQRLF